MVFFCIHNSKAQGFSTKQLVGTKWQKVNPEGLPTRIWEFTKKEIRDTNIYPVGIPIKTSRKYYLSTDIPASFNFKRVGKNKKGKYLVYYVDKSEMMCCEEIVEITKDSLKLFHKRLPDSIGDNDSYLLFRKLK